MDELDEFNDLPLDLSDDYSTASGDEADQQAHDIFPIDPPDAPGDGNGPPSVQLSARRIITLAATTGSVVLAGVVGISAGLPLVAVAGVLAVTVIAGAVVGRRHGVDKGAVVVLVAALSLASYLVWALWTLVAASVAIAAVEIASDES